MSHKVSCSTRPSTQWRLMVLRMVVVALFAFIVISSAWSERQPAKTGPSEPDRERSIEQEEAIATRHAEADIELARKVVAGLEAEENDAWSVVSGFPTSVYRVVTQRDELISGERELRNVRATRYFQMPGTEDARQAVQVRGIWVDPSSVHRAIIERRLRDAVEDEDGVLSVDVHPFVCVRQAPQDAREGDPDQKVIELPSAEFFWMPQSMGVLQFVNAVRHTGDAERQFLMDEAALTIRLISGPADARTQFVQFPWWRHGDVVALSWFPDGASPTILLAGSRFVTGGLLFEVVSIDAKQVDLAATTVKDYLKDAYNLGNPKEE